MHFLRIAIAALCIALVPLDGIAKGDHNRARDAMESGQIQPLSSILAKVRGRFEGRVIDARLKGGKGGRRMIYVLKLLRDDGKVTKVTVDATTGAILGAR